MIPLEKRGMAEALTFTAVCIFSGDFDFIVLSCSKKLEYKVLLFFFKFCAVTRYYSKGLSVNTKNYGVFSEGSVAILLSLQRNITSGILRLAPTVHQAAWETHRSINVFKVSHNSYFEVHIFLLT